MLVKINHCEGFGGSLFAKDAGNGGDDCEKSEEYDARIGLPSGDLKRQDCWRFGVDENFNPVPGGQFSQGGLYSRPLKATERTGLPTAIDLAVKGILQ